jgi:hypothetical protein
LEADLWASPLPKLWYADDHAWLACMPCRTKLSPTNIMLYCTIFPRPTHPRSVSFTCTSTHLFDRTAPATHSNSPTATPHHHPHPLIPLKNPLLSNPRHKFYRPLLNSPLAARARQHFLTITAAAFTLQQHQFVYILAVSCARLAFPLVLAKVHTGEICSGVCCIAGRGDGDVLGCEGVLGSDVV